MVAWSTLSSSGANRIGCERTASGRGSACARRTRGDQRIGIGHTENQHLQGD
jgi:hypothetical protein